MKYLCVTDTNVHGYKFPITRGLFYTGTLEITKHGTYIILTADDSGKESGFPIAWFNSIHLVREKKLESIGI